MNRFGKYLKLLTLNKTYTGVPDKIVNGYILYFPRNLAILRFSLVCLATYGFTLRKRFEIHLRHSLSYYLSKHTQI